MKKYLFLLFLIPFNVHAADMCVKNDTVMVVLDPVSVASNLVTDKASMTWTALYRGIPISGIIGCSDEAGLNSGDIATDQSAVSQEDVGKRQCFCKMLRPAVSKWVYTSQVSNCSVCTCSYITTTVAQGVTFRRGLFGSIGN